MLKTAVIGLGKMGLLHASLLNTMPEVRLVALCEKSALIRRFASKAFGNIRMVAKPSDLADAGFDIVFVATPPSTHYPIIREIYRTRIARNVFVEKPLALSAVQSAELRGLAQKRGVNMVGYNRRFAVTFKKAKELLDSGSIGRLFDFEGHAYSSDLLGVRSPSEGLMKVGVLWDLGCHIIDIALWYFGRLEVENADVSPLSGDAFFSVAGKGIVGEFRASWYKEGYRLPEIGLRVVGSKGELKVNDDRVEVKTKGRVRIWHRQDLGDTVPFFLGGSEYYREDEAFVKAAKSGDSIEPDFQSALEVDRIIAQVEQRTKVS